MIIQNILDTDLYKFTTSYAYIKLFPYAEGTFTFQDRDQTVYTEEFLKTAKREIEKLREVKLGYQFPSKWFAKTPIKNLGLSLVGRNLFMWTKGQDYVDPESIAYEGGTVTPGVEEMAYPSTRSIGFNVNITF